MSNVQKKKKFFPPSPLQDSYGTTKSIEVAPEFFLGGVKREVMDDPAAQRNLMVSGGKATTYCMYY